jgi:hypothetical protein
MALDNKPLEAIEEADLRELVENQVAESKVIDYKTALPGNSDSAKTEFLADTSSFANAGGGHLVFGIEAPDGAPTELTGLGDVVPDAEVLRLENILRDGIQPRIPGVSIRAIALPGLKVAIVVRIPRSWALPHRVTFKGHGHFYSRNSAGKYRLDVSELRSVFALSETTAERIRNFRAERLSMIVSGETPVPLPVGAKIVLHIVPLNAFDVAARFDVTSLAQRSGLLQPLTSGRGWTHRINFDGIVTYSDHSYFQFFRNGSVEAVDSYLLRLIDNSKFIPSVVYERDIIDGLRRYSSIQKELGVEPPLLVMLNLVSVLSYTMGVDQRYSFYNGHPIDRDTLIVPEVMVENFGFDPAAALRPAFDAVWNAAGWPRSINYNNEGNWVGH